MEWNDLKVHSAESITAITKVQRCYMLDASLTQIRTEQNRADEPTWPLPPPTVSQLTLLQSQTNRINRIEHVYHKTRGGKAVDMFIWKAEGCYNTAATQHRPGIYKQAEFNNMHFHRTTLFLEQLYAKQTTIKNINATKLKPHVAFVWCQKRELEPTRDQPEGMTTEPSDIYCPDGGHWSGCNWGSTSITKDKNPANQHCKI